MGRVILRGGLGAVRLLFGVRREAVPVVRHQPGARVSYELTPANVAEVKLAGELLTGLGDGVARELFGDLAYRSGTLGATLRGRGIRLVTERAKQRGKRQQMEIAFTSLKREFRLGETLAKTLVGLATRMAAKITAYTYGFLLNRLLGRPQGRIKELWA